MSSKLQVFSFNPVLSFLKIFSLIPHDPVTSLRCNNRHQRICEVSVNFPPDLSPFLEFLNVQSWKIVTKDKVFKVRSAYSVSLGYFIHIYNLFSVFWKQLHMFYCGMYLYRRVESWEQRTHVDDQVGSSFCSNCDVIFHAWIVLDRRAGFQETWRKFVQFIVRVAKILFARYNYGSRKCLLKLSFEV